MASVITPTGPWNPTGAFPGTGMPTVGPAPKNTPYILESVPRPFVTNLYTLVTFVTVLPNAPLRNPPSTGVFMTESGMKLNKLQIFAILSAHSMTVGVFPSFGEPLEALDLTFDGSLFLFMGTAVATALPSELPAPELAAFQSAKGVRADAYHEK